jgi:hypothetical protein
MLLGTVIDLAAGSAPENLWSDHALLFAPSPSS